MRRPIHFTSFGLVAHSVASIQAASSECEPGRHPIYGPIHGAASVIRLQIPSAKTAPLRGGEVGILSGTPGQSGQGDPHNPPSPPSASRKVAPFDTIVTILTPHMPPRWHPATAPFAWVPRDAS